MSLGLTFEAAPRSWRDTREKQIELAGALSDLLAKHDNHLLADIGFDRQDVLGPERAFWEEWHAIREPWQL